MSPVLVENVNSTKRTPQKILEELRSTPLEPIHHGMRLQTFSTQILLSLSILLQISNSPNLPISLQDGLQAAFDLLECLPDKAAGINTQPWKYDPDKGGPSFIVNAKAYKIRGVGPPKKNTNTPRPRAIATHTRIEALLLADNLNLNSMMLLNTSRHRNKRKPPQKIQKSQGGSANQTQEIQLEPLEEDGIQEEEQEEEEGGEDHSEEESDHFNNESEDSEDV
ncbi:hypothetical protein M422DRAFT_264801 [Sphaerobolus stellatus SS14]|uniref:Uncharacterized protein n=1 Tax=Sphaerobolus stellatus (strain SS14) TaxID=990650 RepID=A0A0C9V734_SPHS4|nr:hypothetical protein M422DRAFT_264801 [Sphaerobolus stellatus SS14]